MNRLFSIIKSLYNVCQCVLAEQNNFFHRKTLLNSTQRQILQRSGRYHKNLHTSSLSCEAVGRFRQYRSNQWHISQLYDWHWHPPFYHSAHSASITGAHDELNKVGAILPKSLSACCTDLRHLLSIKQSRPAWVLSASHMWHSGPAELME